MNDKEINYNSLDGLRGLAFLLVLFSHASNNGLLLFDGFSISGTGSGKIGVFLFFVLSAFLLTDQILKRYNKESIFSREHIMRYAKRRFLRIYPLYTFFILVLLISATVLSKPAFDEFNDFDILKFVKHIFLIESDGHLWTITTEFKFYIVLPFLCYLLLSFRDNIVFSALYISAVSVVALALKYFYDFQLGLYFHIFMCGSASAILVNKYPLGLSKLTARNSNFVLLLVSFALFALLPHVFQYLSGALIDVQFPIISAIIAFLWAILLVNVVWYDNYFRVILGSRIFRYIGMISFSGYIWHVLVIDLVVDIDFLSAPGKLLLFLVMSFGVSHASYLVLEKPFLVNPRAIRE